MAWIKRNLIFVISVAVGLILTGYCGYLLYSALNANSSTNDDYQATVANLQGIEQKSPYPSKESIEAANADVAHIQQFLGEFKKSFSPFPPASVKDDKGFKVYLEESLVKFRAEATNAGVDVPPEYGFSFGGLINKLNYPPSDIAAWMNQLQEISAILDVLYKAKINYLSSLCRVPVSADDTGAGDCLIQAATVTNQWGVVTPYKITFRGFSTEVAAVLDGFARASNCFIVKSVDVGADAAMQNSYQTQSPSVRQPEAPAYMAPVQRNPLIDRGMRGGGRLPPQMQAPPPPRASAPATVAASAEPPVIFLSESPLMVTMAVDVVKLKTSEH